MTDSYFQERQNGGDGFTWPEEYLNELVCVLSSYDLNVSSHYVIHFSNYFIQRVKLKQVVTVVTIAQRH